MQSARPEKAVPFVFLDCSACRTAVPLVNRSYHEPQSTKRADSLEEEHVKSQIRCCGIHVNELVNVANPDI